MLGVYETNVLMPTPGLGTSTSISTCGGLGMLRMQYRSYSGGFGLRSIYFLYIRYRGKYLVINYLDTVTAALC
jgi:hypothetical protein